MYIEPNTSIKLLKNVPLDNNYTNTLFFNSVSEQTTYFTSKAKHTLMKQTYQRVNRGIARVQLSADKCYDCNYMMFQNTSYGSKWFYAFITNVEYVNNEVCEIKFEIDVMQSWFYGCTLKQCFVEREHIESDVIGANLVEENLELGEYVADDFDGTGHAKKKIVVAATFNESYEETDGSLYCGIFSGAYYNVFDTSNDGITELVAFLNGAYSKGKAEEIIAIFYVPADFVTDRLGSVVSYDLVKEKAYANIDGYVPKNKKLFTYPYNFLYVSNLQGNECAYRYEFFTDESCNFIMTGTMSSDSTLLIAPKNYKGVPVNYDEKMALTGYPQCTYNVDTFKQWLAQSAISLPLGIVSSSLSTYAGFNNVANMSEGRQFTGEINAINNGLNNTFNSVSQMYQKAIAPSQSKGSAGNSAMLALGLLDFAFMHKHITQEFAMIIDNYFNMYGYATHRVKIPNISSRPHWNYVKTNNCTIVGSAPSEDIKQMCNIFNNGITFWKNGDEVGNYDLDNSPE